MQVLSISSGCKNSYAVSNSASLRNNLFLNKAAKDTLSLRDTISFGRKEDDDEEERDEAPRARKPKRSGGKAKFVLKGAAGILAALGFTTGGFQAYNAASAIAAQNALDAAFRDNPKNVAVRFMKTFTSEGGVFGGDTLHFEQSGDFPNPFVIKNWNDTFPGPDSVVAYDFADGKFSSASLDIDGDDNPEITVTTGGDKNLVISYDYDSDGKIDTVETINKEDN